MKAFVGIDVAVAKSKRLPVVICAWEGDRLVPFPLRRLDLEPPRGPGNVACLDDDAVESYADRAADYILGACHELGVSPVRIAIDAPRTPCGLDNDRRAAEGAMDHAGISCFTTPSASRFEAIRGKVALHLREGGAVSRLPHANQLWMLAGFALFRRLADVAPCIEVYPQATVRALGAAGVHKGRAGAVATQLEAASRYTGWPADAGDLAVLKSAAWAPLHDCLDAYLSAWVAALDEEDRIGHGTPPDDVIWVPRLSA